MISNLKHILERLAGHGRLSRQEADDTLVFIASGNCDPAQIAAVLMAYNVRQPDVEELRGFRDAMLRLATPVNLGTTDIMDVCGTGGDGKDTFNISTITSLVVAAAGIRVAKHGNSSVSSACGSSDVLAAAGVRFAKDESGLKRQIGNAGICFIHAPYFHPAMKHVAPVRRALGIKTFFNILGPLTNPSRPAYQVAGVYSSKVARMYYHMLHSEGRNFKIVHDLRGYDEISLTGQVQIFDKNGEHLLSPEDFGLGYTEAGELGGGNTIDEAASIFKEILEGRGSMAQRNVVAANAGLAMSLYKGTGLKESVKAAAGLLADGKAKQILDKVVGTEIDVR